MNTVRALRERAQVTQHGLATRGGTSQPTIAAYEADRKSPSINTLRRLAASVGLEAMVEYHSPLTREDRRSLFLHRVIADRLLTDPDGVIAQARKNLARMSRRAATSQPLREWRVILDRPVAALATLLVDPEPWARELRHVTPFAGVLSGAERAALYRAFAESERLAP